MWDIQVLNAVTCIGESMIACLNLHHKLNERSGKCFYNFHHTWSLTIGSALLLLVLLLMILAYCKTILFTLSWITVTLLCLEKWEVITFPSWCQLWMGLILKNWIPSAQCCPVWWSSATPSCHLIGWTTTNFSYFWFTKVSIVSRWHQILLVSVLIVSSRWPPSAVIFYLVCSSLFQNSNFLINLQVSVHLVVRSETHVFHLKQLRLNFSKALPWVFSNLVCLKIQTFHWIGPNSITKLHHFILNFLTEEQIKCIERFINLLHSHAY